MVRDFSFYYPLAFRNCFSLDWGFPFDSCVFFLSQSCGVVKRSSFFWPECKMSLYVDGQLCYWWTWTSIDRFFWNVFLFFISCGCTSKTLLKLTIPRIKLLRNRRELQIKQMRKEIAKLLETGQEATARIRVIFRSLSTSYHISDLNFSWFTFLSSQDCWFVAFPWQNLLLRWNIL